MAIVINPISPIAFSVFGLGIRWYALAYIAAFVIGYWMMRRMARRTDTKNFSLSKKDWDDLLAAVILGVILGGRFGYVLFYNLSYYMAHPLEIFAVWNGGMSFHGGLIGVIVAVFIFAMRKTGSFLPQDEKNGRLPWLKTGFSILDMMSVVAPIGLFFGRIANFINMEVMGRPTTGPLGVVFAGMPDQTPRHPSPLYEAGLEGIALFIIMFCLWNTKLRNRTGALGGVFAILYALFRMIAELFRAPDAHIGFLTSWGLTMGQLLSAVMFIAGAIVFAFAMRKQK